MSFRARAVALLIALMVVISLIPAQAAPLAQQNKLPRFEEQDKCAYDLPAGQTIGKEVHCGYVIAPELHSQPNGKTIRLAVMIYKADTPNPDNDAVIFLQGGPGGTSEVFAQLMAEDAKRSQITAYRDAIVFDQRGIGKSQPSLDCSEIKVDNVTARVTEAIPKDIADLSACMKRLEREGQNLAAYNTAEDAADVNDIRVALGYDKLDVYGASYGTLLGQVLLRDHPEAVRGMILDSVVPLGVDVSLAAPASFSRDFSKVFDACAADADCHAAFPDLHAAFSRTFTRLNNQPVKLDTVNSKNAAVTVTLSGDAFVGELELVFYSTTLLPAVPLIIDSVDRGDYEIAGQLLALANELSVDGSEGVQMSVNCADMIKAATPEQLAKARAGLLPEIAAVDGPGLQEEQNLCKAWPGNHLNDPPLAPLQSDVPTLVLAGEFDPITPPPFAQQVLTGLSNHYYVDLPANGHASGVEETCAFGIVAAFLDDPSTPDSSCAADLKINFLTSLNGRPRPTATPHLQRTPTRHLTETPTTDSGATATPNPKQTATPSTKPGRTPTVVSQATTPIPHSTSTPQAFNNLPPAPTSGDGGIFSSGLTVALLIGLGVVMVGLFIGLIAAITRGRGRAA